MIIAQLLLVNRISTILARLAGREKEIYSITIQRTN